MLFFTECDDYCQQAAEQARQVAMAANEHNAFIMVIGVVMLLVGVLLTMIGFDHVHHYHWETDAEYATKKRNSLLCKIVGISLLIPPVLKLLVVFLFD